MVEMTRDEAQTIIDIINATEEAHTETEAQYQVMVKLAALAGLSMDCSEMEWAKLSIPEPVHVTLHLGMMVDPTHEVQHPNYERRLFSIAVRRDHSVAGMERVSFPLNTVGPDYTVGCLGLFGEGDPEPLAVLPLSLPPKVIGLHDYCQMGIETLQAEETLRTAGLGRFPRLLDYLRARGLWSPRAING